MTHTPDTAWLRQMGDSWAVDTNYMRQIYKASPQRGMSPPRERAEMYLRALAARGMQIRDDLGESPDY
jgi:hypothetical protein